MKTIAVINSLAGSVGSNGAQRLKIALRKVGLERADICELDRQDSAAQFRGIERESADLVIIWGGDGTHRSALEALGRQSSKLLLLPGGTMNLLPKWLHGDRPWGVVLSSVLASPTPRIIPAGKVGEHLFFCAFLAGIPAKFAEAREDFRRGDFGRAIQDAGVALENVSRIRLATSFGKDNEHVDHHFPAGNLVGALVGPLAREQHLEIVRMNMPSAVAALDVAWSGFLNNWRQRKDVQSDIADVLLVETSCSRDIPAIIDGELIEPRPRFEVSYLSEAASCLVAATS